jgi:hypothetical protein
MLRYYICIVISFFFFSSCFFQQKVVKNEPMENKVPIPEKKEEILVERLPDSPSETKVGESKHAEQKRDTLPVVISPQTKIPNSDKIKPIRHQPFKVVVALPLDGSYGVNRFAEFVNGLLIANQISNSDVLNKIKIDVVNIGNQNTELELEQFEPIKKANLLIGGYQTSQIKALSTIALSKKIPFISLWNTSEDIVQDNPLYIQLKPSLTAYCNAISDYISHNIRPALAIILLESRDSKDVVTSSAFESMYTLQHTPYKVMYGSDIIDWKVIFDANSSVVVNIPNWDNKSFVFSALKQIIEAKKDKNVLVTGMPQWMSWDQVDFSVYEKVNLIIPYFNNISTGLITTEIFNKNYFEKNGTWPTAESYYGFDVFQMIKKAGLINFEGESLNPALDLSGQYLSYYKIMPAMKSDIEGNSKLSYFQNVYLTIQKFEGGRFVPVQ